jgi:acyl-CoA synthetase (AMP-forming)/AMP-acid ligase II
MTHPNNLPDFLLQGKDAGRVALSWPGGHCTYGDLTNASRRIAGALRRFGVGKGERVVLLSDNSLFWVACYLGTMRSGAVCVPLSTSASPQDLQFVLESTEPRLCFVQARQLKKHRTAFAGQHVVTDLEALPADGLASQQSLEQLWAATPAGEELPGPRPDDLAALIFTSGSTGRPRGVMVSHANIMANAESIIEYLRLTERDRMMVVLPLHYCYGASLLHTHLRVGGSLVLEPRFLYPEVVLRELAAKECTGFAGVPSHFQVLLRNSGIRDKSFPKLRHVQQAGGPLAPAFIAELRAALPGTQVFIMYGQTEATARLSYLPPEILDTKLGSIGKGIPGVELRVVNERGQPVPPGEVGEIVARGANVAQGYWRAPEESAATFRGGWLHTGDLATVDKDGFIFIVDRMKDILKCGGNRISCRQLEQDLLNCPDLLEAAVIGIPDEILGEAVKAFVVPRAGSPEGLPARLAAFCKEKLPPPLRPKSIVVLNGLPKNDSGKVLKAALRSG